VNSLNNPHPEIQRRSVIRLGMNYLRSDSGHRSNELSRVHDSMERMGELGLRGEHTKGVIAGR
jgi:hypothetical protein